MNILLAMVLGVFMGTGFAFFFEYMDNTVKTQEDVQRRLGLPVLGYIPFEKRLAQSKCPTLLHPSESGRRSQGSETYPAFYDLAAKLPAKIYFTQPGMPGQILLLESAGMGGVIYPVSVLPG